MSVIYTPSGKAREYGELAVNLFDGCPHGCTYCYVPAILKKTREEFHATCTPRKDILERLEKDLKKMNRADKKEVRRFDKDMAIYGQADRPRLYAGKQIFLCFTCDPYPMGYDSSVTREAIKLIHQHGFFVNILTKGKDAERDFDLLSKKDSFGVTQTRVQNPLYYNQFEPKAATYFQREQLLRRARLAGKTTWVSLEPVLDSACVLHFISAYSDFVDLFKIGKWNYSPEAKKIDWKKFAQDAVALCEKLGVKYELKKDLKEEL